MREWVLYKDMACQVINNASFNAENVKVEFKEKGWMGEYRMRKEWVPVAECTPITKEVADIILSNA